MKTNNSKDKIANTLMAILFVFLMTLLVTNVFGQDGKVTREVWTGISGTTISKIPLTTTPNSTGTLTSIQAPVNIADNYGQRIKGYIVPSTTGLYNLYISSNDNGELWLSTNDQAVNKTKIASVSGWTKSLEWTKYTSQKSAVISLTAGQYYYFEALMKEGTGGDNLAIGWTCPGISSVTVIGTNNISTTATTVDTQAPTAPTSLASTLVTQTGFTLSWTASTDNVAVTSYDVYKDGILYTNVTTTSASISSLTCNAAYSMTVKAKDTAGNVSSASSALSVTTSACSVAGTTINFQNLTDGQISSNPYIDNSGYKFSGYNSTNSLENLYAKNHDNTIAIINGNWGGKVVIEKSDASSFNLTSFDYHGDPWNGTADATVTGTYAAGGTVSSSFTGGATFATLTLNWSNLLKVEINYNGGTNNSYGLIDNVVVSAVTTTTDTQAPSAPTSLASASVAQTSFTLSWTASTDNVAVTSYDVYKDGTLYTNVTTTSASISSLTCNTAYSMTVKAKDAAGNVSAASSSKSVTTSSCSTSDTQAPTASTNLSSSNVSSSSFTLSWTASTDNVGVASYEVFAGTTSKGTTTSTSLSVTGLSASTTYTMTVKAKDAAGNISSASSSLNVTTSAAVATTRTNNIGINTSNLGIDWSSDKVFADAIRASRQWIQIGKTNNDPEPAMDANYWPTVDAQCLVYAGLSTKNNNGTYKLSFTGQATIATNAGTLSNQVYDAGSNTTTADLVISDVNNADLTLTFTNTKRTASSTTNTGLTNLKLMRPTAPGSATSYASTELFMTDYINQLAPFKCIRSLGWVACNWNQDSVWSDRTLMQHARQCPPSGGKAYGWEGRGASYESLILFANQAKKDVWLNIPHKVTDDYVTKLAQLFKYGSDGVNPYTSTQANPVYPPLNSNLKLYVEWSNEIWNDQFSQTSWTYAQAAKNAAVKFDGETNTWTWGMRYKAVRTVEISSMFRNVFGADIMTRVRPVLCAQKGYNDRTYMPLSFMDNYYNKRDSRSTWNDPHPVNYYIYGFGNSFYWYTDNSTVTTETIWSKGSWNTTSSSLFYDEVAWDAGMAKQYGLAYLNYEGDMHPTYQGGDEAVVKALHTGTWDARMNQNTIEHLNVLNKVDAELYNFLNLNGTDGSVWAVRNVVNPSNSPQTTAINTFNSSTPLAITVGSVAPFSRAGNAYDNRGNGASNTSGTGSTTITANATAWGSSSSSSYLMRVNAAGTYNVQIQYKTTAAATLVLEFAGNVIATYNLANTNGVSTLTAFANFECSTDKLYAIRPVCTSGSVVIEYVNVGTGAKSENTLANQNATDYSISVYPNPATDYITINLANVSENDKTNITLSDLTGKIVYKNIVAEVNNVTIATDYLTKGMYIINITNGNNNFNQKLIIK